MQQDPHHRWDHHHAQHAYTLMYPSPVQLHSMHAKINWQRDGLPYAASWHIFLQTQYSGKILFSLALVCSQLVISRVQKRIAAVNINFVADIMKLINGACEMHNSLSICLSVCLSLHPSDHSLLTLQKPKYVKKNRFSSSYWTSLIHAMYLANSVQYCWVFNT